MANLVVPPFERVDDTLGAAFIGFACSCVIYGVLCTQVYTYYKRYRNDKIAYKLFAGLLWVFATVDQCFIGNVIYNYAVINYANPRALTVDKPIWTLILQVTLGSIIGTAVKTAFAVQVWKFSNYSFLIPSILLALTFMQLGLAVVYTVDGFRLQALLDLPQLKTIATLALGAGVLTDTLTAGALCYYLRKLRIGSPSDSLANDLSQYAINCGVLTSAFSLATLLTYNLLSKTFVFMVFYFALSKLYAVSFLATLNTRKIVRGRETDQEDLPSFVMYGESAAARLQHIKSSSVN